LQPSAFSGAQAVYTLVEKIADYGSQDVDAGTRLDILTKIRDGAGNHYFRAWAENATAIDIMREWLKAAFTAKSDSSLVETIMPLLHVSGTQRVRRRRKYSCQTRF
jgi:protein phosphatase 1 regulatory subunit 10